MAVIGRMTKERSEPFTLHRLQDPFKAARQSFVGNYRLDFGAGQRAYDMNPKFATALRMSRLIPMVQPQYKREAIRELLAELKKAIG